MAKQSTVEIKPAKGKLGIMIPGMGAVATTFIAGVEAIRKGLAKPIGSLTQMGTVRLGKRTEGRSPLIRDLVPLSDIGDLVFGGWDIFLDSAYDAATKAGVLSREHLHELRPFLETIKPMAGVFDQDFVKKLKGTNTKKAGSKAELAEQLMADIEGFRKRNTCERLV